MESGSASRRLRRKVRFTPKPSVIGNADAGVDRISTPPALFDCDVCSSRIHAGLRGFDLFAHCEICEFDACLSCCDNADEASTGAAPACAAHACLAPLALVDRNRDGGDVASMVTPFGALGASPSSPGGSSTGTQVCAPAGAPCALSPKIRNALFQDSPKVTGKKRPRESNDEAEGQHKNPRSPF